jgi:hypothetical protein
LGLIFNDSLVLGFLGALASLALSMGWLSLIQNFVINDDSPILIWSLENVIRALVGLALALVGGSYPAFRATLLQTVEALSYEKRGRLLSITFSQVTAGCASPICTPLQGSRRAQYPLSWQRGLLGHTSWALGQVLV